MKVNRHLEENIASVFMVEEYAKQETSMKQVCTRIIAVLHFVCLMILVTTWSANHVEGTRIMFRV
jgi:hypothetical protein